MKVANNMSKQVSVAVLTAALCSLAVIAAVQAQQDNQEQALRELKIMSNIFGAALESDDQQNRMRMGPPEAMYLAGQGMVFTFQMNGMSGIYFGGQMQKQMEQLRGQMEQQTAQLKEQETAQLRAQTEQLRAQSEQLRAQAEQIAQDAQALPQVYVDTDTDFDFDFDYDFDFDFDFDDGFANDEDEAYRNQLSDMNEAMRDKQEEMRDMQREIRNLAREERDDPDTDNQAEIDRISTAMEAMGQEIQTQSASMQQLQQEYQSARLAVFNEMRTLQTDLIFDTLCSYGNTLRSLDNGQHVNIVLRNYADDQSQVYVLDYPDLANCTSATALRGTAVSYLQSNGRF